MTDTPAIEELESRISFYRAQLSTIKEEITDALKADLPHFFNREFKRLFIATPEFASKLDDLTIQQLKGQALRAGEEAGRTLAAKLQDDALWLAGMEVAEPDTRSLMPNRALWDVVNTVTTDIEELLSKHGFPKGPKGYQSYYKMPSWFIEGHYLPGLAEKYWKTIAEMKLLQDAVEEERQRTTRDALAKRWDDIAID